ncbi:hypothetical protein, partial [Halodesulfovibrio sp.]|uniref:hypothetical protein n=1 Tax=Halodesulfovibrio sp. TaxID=1912772 RepID=UPI0025BDDCDC
CVACKKGEEHSRSNHLQCALPFFILLHTVKSRMHATCFFMIYSIINSMLCGDGCFGRDSEDASESCYTG